MENIFGPHKVVFANGVSTIVDVEINIVDSYAHPVYLISKDGVIYNWQNIYALEKVVA